MTPTREQVLVALENTSSVAAAAQLLGISERTMYRRMREYGIRTRRVVHQEAA